MLYISLLHLALAPIHYHQTQHNTAYRVSFSLTHKPPSFSFTSQEDCLVERIRAPPADFSRRRSSGNYCNYYYYNNNNNHVATSRSCRKPVSRPDQRKRAAPGSAQPVVAEAAAAVLKRPSRDDSRVARSQSLEMTTILRRGQSLDSAVKSEVYAGSAFAVSPSPEALPLPSFSTKKQDSVAVDDSATRDLRRLLRLE
ncbi:hypothetical protein JHK82_019821 [Glycine max]|nr:hypothetical protein JHK85_020271 [Glycine max]KAG5038999.1 hypothetical protein JHK86_019839 [Glycine max]KAG5144126.1 hypothetical protein JHK82_019821 [Glycine max]